MSNIETEYAAIPSSPADRKRITDAVQELVDSMLRVDAERTLQTDIKKEIKESLKIKPELLQKFANWKHKGTADQDVSKISEAEAAFRILFKGGTTVETEVENHEED